MENAAILKKNRGALAEMEGFEPTCRLIVDKTSSSQVFCQTFLEFIRTCWTFVSRKKSENSTVFEIVILENAQISMSHIFLIKRQF